MKIEWNKISPKEQAHQLCRYCDKKAQAMNKTTNGLYIPVCKKHEKDQ